jgi:excisionase family DNA binding protein
MGQRTVPGASAALGLLTISGAAALLGCSDNHIYRLIESGELPAVDIAQPGSRRSKTRVRDDDVQAYISRKTRRRPAPVRVATTG